MAMNSFTINPASETDVPILLAMIRELAVFEDLTCELEVTDGSLRNALFGPRPAASALLARAAGEPAGYAVFFRTFSTFVGRPGIFLDDLYVRPPFREHGIGRALLQRVAQTGLESAGRFEWITLRWNQKALRFYRDLGAKVMVEWALLRMNGPEVRALGNAAVKVGA
jgi:GNAT superfamily N-acetyltransferase